MVARRTEQYEHKPRWHRNLSDVVEQRCFLQSNECVQWIRQAVHVANQDVGRFGAGRNFLDKMLIVLQTQTRTDHGCQVLDNWSASRPELDLGLTAIGLQLPWPRGLLDSFSIVLA